MASNKEMFSDLLNLNKYFDNIVYYNSIISSLDIFPD